MAERPAPAFLAGGGRLGSVIPRRDWPGAPLGPRAAWSPSLRTTIGPVLRSPVPMATLWVADGIMVSDDAYEAFAGDRSPELLGSTARGGWDETADLGDDVMRPGLDVSLITGRAETAAIGDGHLAPGMAVTTEPFARDDLAAKIRGLTAG